MQIFYNPVFSRLPKRAQNVRKYCRDSSVLVQRPRFFNGMYRGMYANAHCLAVYEHK